MVCWVDISNGQGNRDLCVFPLFNQSKQYWYRAKFDSELEEEETIIELNDPVAILSPLKGGVEGEWDHLW